MAGEYSELSPRLVSRSRFLLEFGEGLAGFLCAPGPLQSFGEFKKIFRVLGGLVALLQQEHWIVISSLLYPDLPRKRNLDARERSSCHSARR